MENENDVDLSKYNIQPIQQSNNDENVDLNNYGLIPIQQQNNVSPQVSATSKLMNKAYQAADNSPSQYDIASANQIVNPLKYLKIPLSNYNPLTSLKEIAGSVGKPLMLTNPELMEGPGVVEGLVNTLGRIGQGVSTTTSQQLDNINTFQDLKNNVLSNLKLNSLLEVPSAAIRSIGGISEFLNPQQYATEKMQQINQNAMTAKAKMQAAYQPVYDKYDDNWVTSTPDKYLGFDNTDKQYFTPQVNKSYKDFVAEPTFQNLRELQTQMGKDWARIAGNSNLTNQADSLSMSRDLVNSKIQSYLKNDPEMLSQYNDAVGIARDEYYPHLATPTLESISEGRNFNFSPSDLAKDIRKEVSSKNPAIPEGHYLRDIGQNLQTRVNMGNAGQWLLPMAVGTAASEYEYPGYRSGFIGLGAGAALKHYLEPGLIKVAQNPFIRSSLQNVVSPLYYGTGRNIIGQNSLS